MLGSITYSILNIRFCMRFQRWLDPERSSRGIGSCFPKNVVVVAEDRESVKRKKKWKNLALFQPHVVEEELCYKWKQQQ